MKSFYVAFRSVLVLSLLTGIVYPLVVTAVAAGVFPESASGSLVRRDGNVVGSALVAQKFTSPGYFHPRPSAVDFATVASGASNQGPTSAALVEAVAARRAALGADAPPELVLASGSGLDPHLSPEAARFQVEGVMTARSIGADRRAEVEELVTVHVEPPTFGFLGRPRVDVLLLNLALDERFP